MTSKWVFIIPNKFGVPIFSDHEKAGRKGFTKNAHSTLVYKINTYTELQNSNSLTVYYELKTCGATRNPEFPRTGPDRTETGPGSGNILKNIFGSGRVGEFYFGSVRVGESDFGSVRVRVFFLPGYETFSPGFSGINLPFIPKLKK